jgi:hypothetical protein
MNLTIDEFIEGLERTARELPAVLSEWDELDEELKDEYTEQLFWLLAARARVIGGERALEIADRIARVTSAMFELRVELQQKMGIAPDRIVPHLAYSAPVKHDRAYALAV